jgi:hypothetical protein
MNLPAPLRKTLEPLFAALPLDQAMSQLVVKDQKTSPHVSIVEQLVQGELPSPLKAALWLYVDELDKSHRLAQQIEDQTGSYWHGIMHRREGDFSNSHYWFNKVGQHPAMARIPGYDAHAFIDAVSKGHSAELVALQRREWENLFSWCAGQ